MIMKIWLVAHVTFGSLGAAITQVIKNHTAMNNHVLAFWTLVIDQIIVDSKSLLQINQLFGVPLCCFNQGLEAIMLSFVFSFSVGIRRDFAIWAGMNKVSTLRQVLWKISTIKLNTTSSWAISLTVFALFLVS